MSAARLLEEIRSLPEAEKEMLLDRLEEEQDLREAKAVLNDPNTEWVMSPALFIGYSFPKNAPFANVLLISA